MGHEFAITQQAEIEAPPEEVWEAIATGPGMDSWFMGRNEIEPGEGGRIGLTIADETIAATVTVWEPPTRFVGRSDTSPEGAFHEFDYRIDRSGPSSSTVRYEHSGMLSGDWEAEYEAMSQGDPMYFAKLAEYLTYFRGRYAMPVNAFGPPVASPELAMAMFRHSLGIDQDAAEGGAVRMTPYGFSEEDGVIDHASTSFLGVRTADAMYRFIHAFTGPAMVGHHLFAEGVDQRRAEADWTAWLERLFGTTG